MSTYLRSRGNIINYSTIEYQWIYFWQLDRIIKIIGGSNVLLNFALGVHCTVYRLHSCHICLIWNQIF